METATQTIETQWDKPEVEGIESAVKAVAEATIAANEDVELADPKPQVTVGNKRRGPKAGPARSGKAHVVLPVTFPPHLVEKIDQAWQDLGLQSRMDLFRQALATFIASAGEDGLAAEIMASGQGRGGRRKQAECTATAPETIAA